MLILLLCAGLAAAQPIPPDDPAFLFSNTAYTLPARRGGFALLHNSRYGVSRRVELGFHPLMMFLSPDIEVKWKQVEAPQFTLSSFHSINYPSFLMCVVQVEGAGGFISPEFTIPTMLAIQNGLIGTTIVGDRHILTGRLTFEFSLKNAKPDARTTVDLPFVYPRAAVYYKDYGFITGLAAEGKVWQRLDYLATVDAYFFPQGGLDFFSETTAGAVWRTGKKFKLLIGGKLTYGEYPFGPQWHLLPVIDFRWFLRI
ncbi:MAG: hypothetical protein EP344_07970 [Bacteroidetes bacterium]|nr:MAG: hypothetical protein EP344_07970 [Bacteroidota bacterium]